MNIIISYLYTASRARCSRQRGGNDREIIDYLKQGYNKGKGIKIYGYSRGNAGIRITNKLGEMGINVYQLTTYDPHSITDGGLQLTHNNVAYFIIISKEIHELDGGVEIPTMAAMLKLTLTIM